MSTVWGSMERVARWSAIILALGAILALWFLPLYGFRAVTETVGESGTSSSGTDTLIGVNGYAVLGVLAVPLLAAVNAVLPWPPRYRRSADILGLAVAVGFCVLGAFTVGMFFLPATAALLVVSVWPRRSHPAT